MYVCRTKRIIWYDGWGLPHFAGDNNDLFIERKICGQSEYWKNVMCLGVGKIGLGISMCMCNGQIQTHLTKCQKHSIADPLGN